MIYANTVNPPKRSDLDVVDYLATVRKFVADYPGFPGYVIANPDQFGSSGEGMSYPENIYGPTWKEACAAAQAAGGVLIPRIGGCATHDLPRKFNGQINQGQVNTMFAKFRPSPIVIADYASGSDAAEECRSLQIGAASTKTALYPATVLACEANAKRDYIIPDGDTWECAEWFLWKDVQVPGATMDDNPNRWKLRELLATFPGTKVVIEITSMSRHDLGYENGVADWAAAKVAIAKQFHAVNPARVIVSVRMSGLSPAEVAELRGLNA